MTRFLYNSACLACIWLTASSLAAQDEATAPAETMVSSAAKYDIHYSVPYADYGESARALLADIYRPKAAGPFPTILMLHGGAWFSGNKAHVALHARYAAAAGYAVVAINYRLAPTHKFPKQLEDCRQAVTWIGANSNKYGFDVDRLAVYGYSAGGHLACLVGVTQNEAGRGGPPDSPPTPTIRAIVAGGAPCEFSWIDASSQRLAFWLGGSRESLPDVYSAASPITFVDARDPPVFFFHGGGDRVVPISSARKMQHKLESVHVASEFHTLPKTNHLGAFVNADARKRAIEFLDTELTRSEPVE